jgi:thioredoxin-like negative regulator of GroEL
MKATIFTTANSDQCKSTYSILKQVCEEHNIDITQIDVASEIGGEYANSVGIKTIPTIVFVDGKNTRKFEGRVISKQTIENILNLMSE